MGYKVLAIEAFYENVLRIHKACFLDETYDNIVLIHNALSDKPNEIKMLNKNDDNVGAQSLLPFNKINFTKNKTNKYLVETILFDDIIPYLPFKNDKNEEFKKAVLKIDIEGFEIFAFQHAEKLFDTLDIKIIFMEWVLIKKQDVNLVEQLIEFLTKRQYEIYGENDGLLNINGWRDWSFNVVWKKKY